MIEITEQQFIDALNRIAATEDGKVILACLKEYCVFDVDIVAQNRDDTYGNAMLRRPYLYLRSRIKPEHLKIIEYNYKRSLTNERSSIATSTVSQRTDRTIGRGRSTSNTGS